MSKLSDYNKKRTRAAATAAVPADGVLSGKPYFDTDLGMPIWWNGSVWVKAAEGLIYDPWDGDIPPWWLTNFPPAGFQVVIGSAWKADTHLTEDDVVALQKVPGEPVWTEDGTQDASLTNRLKLNWYKQSDRVTLSVYALTASTNFTSAVFFTRGGESPYSFKSMFDAGVACTWATSALFTWVSSYYEIIMNTTLFKSMEAITA